MRNTDVYHITVAGINPHTVAEAMQQADNPFYNPVGEVGVSHHIILEGKIVGGIIDVHTQEHLTPAQEQYLERHPHVIDVRHVWPEA